MFLCKIYISFTVTSSIDVRKDPVWNHLAVRVPVFAVFLATVRLVPETAMDQKAHKVDRVEVWQDMAEPCNIATTYLSHIQWMKHMHITLIENYTPTADTNRQLTTHHSGGSRNLRKEESAGMVFIINYIF